MNHPDADADILHRFKPQVQHWFSDVFARPTAVQTAAWQAISAGENALVVAPTGSGKTLAAFLWTLNSLVAASGQTTLPVGNPTVNNLASQAVPPAGRSQRLSLAQSQEHPRALGEATSGVKVLYISPLKALGVDVEHNLRAPLLGINRTAERLGLDYCDISVGVRSGDTTAAERAAQVRRPPDILITTPESAYLLLTSKAASILSTVETVIIDEIHAMAGTKRGVHLALTLERLEEQATQPIQRIGLSATVRPLSTVAAFLGGDRPVEIINPPAEKNWDLQVIVPVADMSDLPTPELGSTIGEITIDDPLGLSTPLLEDTTAAAFGQTSDLAGVADHELATQEGTLDAALAATGAGPNATGSIWPYIETDLFGKIMEHRSTLVFVNSRRAAERLTAKINELYARQHAPHTVAEKGARPPAQVMAPADEIATPPTIIARAHHGSVSKDERKLTETMLKEGSLKAVVATSSLELGIDMGAVDLVVQVEAPPSVASGLQRVGRAGHVVGAVSKGTFYPKHRADLLQTAVAVNQMRAGQIEKIHVPTNALDVLLQQTIAAVAVRDWDVEHWYATVTRSYPYKNLPRDVFDAVIDLASGVYPSTDFAELRPRIIYDRIIGRLSARPGAQRVAVTSGGTIPDRGLFGVYLVGGEQGARRVGELDEEMVYESRVGDVFTLGASSWRIEEITRDQVLVSPAPGLTGRLPFWLGDQAGRPAELGVAIGQFRRAVVADPAVVAAVDKLDGYAQDNLLRFIAEQREATGIVPDEKTLLLERFKDEVGDWRVVLHTPYGRGVNAAWALAVGARISAETGIDAQAVSSDDGIVLRLPEAETEPSAALFVIDPDEIEDLVTQQVGNSALFAARFRECAARGLLLPRKNPGKRAPLWQQRQRAAQLLDVARNYPSFPIILETVRECVQDVYDVPALVELLTKLNASKVRIAEVTTGQPSPFASSILFNYTGAFIYNEDSPLAERRAAALALDPELLAKLLGTVELKDLLDGEVIAEVDQQLRRVSPDRRARNLEELADALRLLGPIPTAALPDHVLFDADLPTITATLAARVMVVRIAGVEHIAQVLDAPLLRDGLGIPVPPGAPAQVAPVIDALQQLVSRWARTRGPFVLQDLQQAFGLAAGVAHSVLKELMSTKVIVKGHFSKGIGDDEFVANDVLKIIRSRSLALARAQTEPVSQSAFGRFLLSWQQVAAVGETPELYGVDGVFAVLEQLAGVRLPASAWESVVLPTRVRGYNPADLDQLCHNGEVVVVGAGAAGSADPWVMLLPADYAAELLPTGEEASLSIMQEQVMQLINRGGGFLFAAIQAALNGDDLGLLTGAGQAESLRQAIWELFELGLVSPDSFAPVRARLAAGRGGRTAHRSRRSPNRTRLRMGRTSFSQREQANQIPPDMLGRWSSVVAANQEPTARSIAHGEAWLDRYGVVTRGSVVAEDTIGGFALAYKVLSGFEQSGRALRGHFITGLGATQFSTPAVIDRLRGLDDELGHDRWPSGVKEPKVYVVAACDPANPYGASLPWPETTHAVTLTRAAGALVVLADGLALAHLTRGGRRLTLFTGPQGVGEHELIALVVRALMHTVQTTSTERIILEKINGESALQSPYLENFRQAGAGITPKGIRIAAPPTAPQTNRGGRSLSEAVGELGTTDVAHQAQQRFGPRWR